MDLETAQEIIEQEALPLLLANPHLKFDVTDGELLADLFYDNKSKVVTEHDQFGGEGQGSVYYYVFKIDHPKYSVSYFKVSGYYDSWNGIDWNGISIVEPITKQVIAWEKA